jgi:hypothetical protein
MKRAASRPAPCFLVTSVVRRYAAIEVRLAKIGARKTQMFLISMGMANLWRTMYRNPLVDCINGVRYHESRVYSSTHITPQGVPRLRIKEVPKLFEVIVDEELGGPEVEPWVELVNDGFVTDH